MRTFLLGVALVAPVAAFAQQPQPEPIPQALGQMLYESQQREANALVQVYTLKQQLAAEKKRADDAQAKATEKPAEVAKP